MRLLELALGALLFLPGISAAQNAGTVEAASFCGLDDSDAGNIIPDCAGKSMLNVETNVGSTALIKRSGYTQQAALSVSTAAVIGSAYFKDSAGNEIIVACSGRTCAAQKNGGAFVTFYTTASASAAPYSCVAANGSLYCGDAAHDAVWKYDGTNFTNPAGIPACSILSLDQDRMLCANTVAAPNSVNYSKSGDYTVWAAGVNSADPFVDFIGTPGDQISGISYWLGVLYIFKQNSIIACQPGDQYTTSCSQLNGFVGTSNPNSIVQAPDGLYFAGSDNNFWKYDGYNFKIVSLKLQGTSRTFTSGSTGFNIQTGEQAWEAGRQKATGSWNTAVIAGSIFSSSFTNTDSSTIDFSSGSLLSNIDTTTVPGAILLSSTTRFENWSNLLIAGRLGWIGTTGGFFVDYWPPAYISGNGSSNIGNYIYTSSIAYSSGSWQFDWAYRSIGLTTCAFDGPAAGKRCMEFQFVNDASGNYYAAFVTDTGNNTGLFNVGLKKVVSGSTTTLTQTQFLFTQSVSSPIRHHFEVQRSTDGRMSLSVDSVFIGSTTADNSVSSQSIKTQYFDNGDGANGGVRNLLTNVYFYNYASSGTFISRPFDTSFTTPTWGPLSSTATINSSEYQVNYSVQVSTSPNNDLWDALIASSDTLRLTNAQKRYVRYKANLLTFISTGTPSISAVSIPAATTGTFISQCINPPSTISSWGLLSCNYATTGNGGITFYSTSAATCAALPTINQTASGWTATNNNAVITVATNTAYALRFDSTLTSSTDTVQVNACTINWQVGTLPPPVWGVYSPQNNAIYWNGSVNNSTTTNRTFKYDLNNTGWWPFDISMQAPLFYKNYIYFGSGMGGYWNQYAPQGAYSDNGSAINSYWFSKDWNLGSAFQEKTLTSVSLVAVNQGSGNLTVTETSDGLVSTSYTVAIGTTTSTSYIRNNAYLPAQSPYTFFNLEFSNNAANNPWSVLGYRFDYTLQPWRALGPP